MTHRVSMVVLGFVLLALTASSSRAATVVHSTGFEECAAGPLSGHPGLESQDWWYRQLSGDATATILASGGDPDHCLELYAPMSNSSGVQTHAGREVEPVDLTSVAIVRVSMDVFCSTSDVTTRNLYRADFEVVGGPHPGYLIAGIRMVAGHDAPREFTGLGVQLIHSPVGSGGLPIPLTVGQHLAWDTWHHVELVIDHASDTYLSLTVNGTTQDLTGYRPPRSWVDGEYLRGQRIEKIQGVVYSYEWGDPVQESEDRVRYDDLLVQTGYAAAPRLLAVEDVGNDQGRQVRLRWLRAESDGPTAPTTLSYDVYRRELSGAKAPGVTDAAGAEAEDTSLARLAGWDYVMSVPAAGDDLYQCVAPTLGDSTAAGIWWSHFLLRATTDDPLVFFESAPDSGYSVDDLSPEAPTGLAVAYAVDGVDLRWSPSPAPDFLLFRVYRSRGAKAAELVCETTAHAWHDAVGTWGDVYSLAVVDDAGNESSAAGPTTVTGAPRARRAVTLHAPVPNPFNPATALVFELPRDGVPVRLLVVDVAGRRVCTLMEEVLDHGRHEAVWDGRDANGRPVASGIYHARLLTPESTRSVKLTLVR